MATNYGPAFFVPTFSWYAAILAEARRNPLTFRIPHEPSPMFAEPATWPRWAFRECACRS